MRAESGSEASGQPAKPPCGPGLNERILAALGTIMVILISMLLVAAPLGVPTARGACRTNVRALYIFGGPLPRGSQDPSLSPRPLGGSDIRSEEGAQPPCTARTQVSHPSLLSNEIIQLAPREAVSFCPGLRGDGFATNK